MSVADSILQLKVTLANTKPPIWRRLQVPRGITLAKLQEVLQVAMGWEDAHLHDFVVGDDHYGAPDPEAPYVQDSRKARLAQVAGQPGMTLFYLYDFGDSWEHHIVVEKAQAPERGKRYPRCV